MSALTTGAIIGLAAASAGSTIASGVINANASNSAANTQANATQQGIDFQKQVYAANQAQQAPYVAAGQAAVGRLGQLSASPSQLPAAYGPYGRSPQLSQLGQAAPTPMSAPAPAG